jgi:hypothetical protein
LIETGGLAWEWDGGREKAQPDGLEVSEIYMQNYMYCVWRFFFSQEVQRFFFGFSEGQWPPKNLKFRGTEGVSSKTAEGTVWF